MEAIVVFTAVIITIATIDIASSITRHRSDNDVVAFPDPPSF